MEEVCAMCFLVRLIISAREWSEMCRLPVSRLCSKSFEISFKAYVRLAVTPRRVSDGDVSLHDIM